MRAEAIWNGISGFLEGVWNGIKGTAESIWNAVAGFCREVWEGVKSVAEETWNSVSAFLKETWSGIKGAAEEIWGGIQTPSRNPEIPFQIASALFLIPSQVPCRKFEIPFQTASAASRDAWDSVTETIGNFAVNTYEKVKDVPEKIYGAVKNTAQHFLPLPTLPGKNLQRHSRCFQQFLLCRSRHLPKKKRWKPCGAESRNSCKRPGIRYRKRQRQSGEESRISSEGSGTE